MPLFKKKDKRYNTYFDNYTEKYKGIFVLGLVYIIVAVICYGLYLLYNYIFY